MYKDMYILYPCTFVLLHRSCAALYLRLDNQVKQQLDVLSSHFLIWGAGK